MTKKTIIIAIAILLILPLTTSCTKDKDEKSASPKVQPEQLAGLENLKIAIGLHRQDEKDFLNQNLSQDDIILIETGKTDLLDLEMSSQKGFISKSISELTTAPHRSGQLQFNYLIYNPSDDDAKNSSTLMSNISYLHQRTRSMSQKLGIIINQEIITQAGYNFAQFTDLIIVKTGEWQIRGVEEYEKNIIPLIERIKKVNPDVWVLAEVSSLPKDGDVANRQATASEMTRVLRGLKDIADGAFITYSPSTVEVMKEFISSIRPPQ